MDKKGMIGSKHNRLTVLSQATSRNYKRQWNCLCECGNESIVTTNDLTSGNTKSCGCLQRESLKKMNVKHGGSIEHKKEYATWCAMKTRCYNEKSTDYPSYGGRGIKLSKEWDESFESFYSDMGDRPSDKHSIDRIDVNGDYCKENCKWATSIEQANNKRVTIRISVNGEDKPIAIAARGVGLDRNVVVRRLQSGLSAEDALCKPQFKKARVYVDLSKAQSLLNQGLKPYKVAKTMGLDCETIENRIKHNLLTAKL